MRGTVADRFWQQLAIRFIPARAGNRISITIALAITLVHPRACGEQEASRLGLDALGGSSPRVRGTVEPPSSDAVARRFIRVKVAMEIHVQMPEGADEHLVRTVKENASTLKFDHVAFEDE